jgi:hypothetical protein
MLEQDNDKQPKAVTKEKPMRTPYVERIDRINETIGSDFDAKVGIFNMPSIINISENKMKDQAPTIQPNESSFGLFLPLQLGIIILLYKTDLKREKG